MEKPDLRELSFTVDPERLEEGSPEEQACFAALGIKYGSIWLTEGNDGFINKIRSAPLLSGYHLAEWMAWNWWRLRWEPRSNVQGWQFAHCLNTIGEGYVWPNITIFSDGARIAFIARPSPEQPNTIFRYLSSAAAVVGAREFEYVFDKFIEQIRGLLRNENIGDTNLDRIWADVSGERREPEIAKRRKLEALLGFDPGEAEEAAIENLVEDAKGFGEQAVNEIAADYPQGHRILTSESLVEAATDSGFDAAPHDVARLTTIAGLPRAREVAAWLLGAEFARALRRQEHVDTQPISNNILAEMSGIQSQALTAGESGPISFALDNGTTGRVVFRSKWETGRRFELARLLGDRIIALDSGRLFPATRAFTYRQKMQRSFAAEFLSPFEQVDQMLAGDYSMENQQDVADYFQVSDLTIRTMLVNHHRLEREDLDPDFESVAA